MATYTNNIKEATTEAQEAAKGIRGQSIASGALTGLSTGLSAGSLLGPVGSGVGAILGLGAGVIAGDIAGQKQQQQMVEDARKGAAAEAKSKMLADIDSPGATRGVSPSQTTSLSVGQRSTSAPPSTAQKYMNAPPTPFDAWNSGVYGG